MTIDIMFTKTLSHSACELACLLPIWYIIKAYPKYLKCMVSLTFHGSLTAWCSGYDTHSGLSECLILFLWVLKTLEPRGLSGVSECRANPFHEFICPMSLYILWPPDPRPVGMEHKNSLLNYAGQWGLEKGSHEPLLGTYLPYILPKCHRPTHFICAL